MATRDGQGIVTGWVGALGRRARVALLLAVVFAAGAGSAALLPADARDAAPGRVGQATPVTDIAATPVTDNPCEALAPGAGSEPWVQTELYFGRGSETTERQVDAEEWQDFLDTEVTPRFPDGLTVLDGYGQFLNSSGTIIAEDSTVLIILYPADPSGETSAALDEIRDAYNEQFDQESVLRTDTAPVCVAF